MRKTVILVAAAGCAVGLGAFGANAMTSTSPAGLRVASEAMGNSALVHCRPYRHWHPWGYGTGCGGGTSVEIRSGHRVGVGVEEREHSSIHSRTTIRGETSVRGSSSTTTGKTSVKSGASTTNKSGMSTGGAQIGEKSSGGSSTGMSGSSGGTTGGQSGQKQ